MFNKDILTINESKFCIAVGVLSERLAYYNTALKFYSKALSKSFSAYLYYRKIKIYIILKDYINTLLQLATFLSCISEDDLISFNKVPDWIKKTVLLLLKEIEIKEIFNILLDCPKYIIDYLNKIIENTHNYWIKHNHDIDVLK